MKKLLFTLIISLLGKVAFSQIESPVTWAYAAKKLNKTEAMILIKATIDDGWHIYSLNVKEGGPVKTTLAFAPSKNFSLVGKTIEPTPMSKYDKNFDMSLTYFEKSAVFQQKVKLKGKKTTVKGTIEFMTCNDQKCLPPTSVEFNVDVAL